jgi:hypothetical protein
MRTFLEIKLAHTHWASNHWGNMTQVISSSFSNANIIQQALIAGSFHGLSSQDVLQSVVQRHEDFYQRIPSEPMLRKMYADAMDTKRSAVNQRVRSDWLEHWIRETRDHAGQPVLSLSGERLFNVPGHFEVIPTMLIDGTVLRLIKRGVRYLAISSIDNLGVRVEPMLIGLLEARGVTLLSEGVLREPGDVGPWLGIRNGRGYLVSREEEIEERFDHDLKHYASIGSFLIHIDRLLNAIGLSRHDLEMRSRDELVARVRLAFSAIPRQQVIREIQDPIRPGLTRPIAQYERSLNDLPLVVETVFVRVGRDRYFPIKRRCDLVNQLPRLRRLAQDAWLFLKQQP